MNSIYIKNSLANKIDFPKTYPGIPEIQQDYSVISDFSNGEDISGVGNFRTAKLFERNEFSIISSSNKKEELQDNKSSDDFDEDSDSDVSESEIEDLEIAENDMPTKDNQGLRKAGLDSRDKDGDPLNEGSFKDNISATDLDVPGSELDDEDEAIGEEDEENNDYSLGGDNHDNIPEDNF